MSGGMGGTAVDAGSALVGDRWQRMLWPVVLAALWLPLLAGLSEEWSVNPQYAYGWLVPPAALMICVQRWRSRPLPDRPRDGGVLAVAVAGYLPWLGLVRLVEEANPEWRLVLWAHGVGAVVMSVLWVGRLGGGAWERHFAAPALFLLLALPWPKGLEDGVIQGLMKGVAAFTVEVVNVAGIPAVQRGNLIEIGQGLVGINEACSGVRSIQSTAVLGVFLGELFRLRTRLRLGLLGAGLVLSLVTNCGRTLFLVLTAARHGLGEVDRVHDTAGVAVMTILLPALWLLATWMQRFGSVRAGAVGVAAPFPFPSSRVAVLALAGMGLVEVGVEGWYRSHEGGVGDPVRWSLRRPAETNQLKELPLPEVSRAMLRNDESTGWAWRDDQGNMIQLFFLGWKPGKNSAQLAQGHTPEICLPGAGYRLQQKLGQRPISIEGHTLPFQQFLFERGGSPVHVFYCLWEQRPGRPGGVKERDGSKESRIRAVLDGERNLGQQVFSIAVSGPDEADAAFDVLVGHLRHMLSVAGRDGSAGGGI